MLYNIKLPKNTQDDLGKIFEYFGPVKCAALRNNFKIYTGRTHSECFLQEDKGVLRNAEQGFITENKIFVNRKFALLIAVWYEQLSITKTSPKDELFSEDLKEVDVIKV